MKNNIRWLLTESRISSLDPNKVNFVDGKLICYHLTKHMENIEQGRPIEFIRHRRETQGYHKVTTETGYRSYTTIERVDNRTEIE